MQNRIHRICVNTSDANILYNFEQVTMQMETPIWGVRRKGDKAIGRMKRGDLILFGHHKVQGFKYVATFVTRTEHAPPDGWTNKDDYVIRFYITNIRRIKTIPTRVVNSRRMTFPYSKLTKEETVAVANELLFNQ